MKIQQVEELVLQSLEHEIGGVEIYAIALECVVNPDLKQEWTKYHQETQTHVTRLESVCKALGIDPKRETPGRAVVRHTGAALVEAMKMALGDCHRCSSSRAIRGKDAIDERHSGCPTRPRSRGGTATSRATF